MVEIWPCTRTRTRTRTCDKIIKRSKQNFEEIEIIAITRGPGLGHDQDNTIGVGSWNVKLCASPEQLNGSDYDLTSSSDIFSLGIILFEYSMSMERIMNPQSVRKHPTYVHRRTEKNAGIWLSQNNVYLYTHFWSPRYHMIRKRVPRQQKSPLTSNRYWLKGGFIFERVETVDNERAMTRVNRKAHHWLYVYISDWNIAIRRPQSKGL